MPARGPQPGDLVAGRYRLELLIGTGGMGAVWSATVEGARESEPSAPLSQMRLGLGPKAPRKPIYRERVAVKFLHAQMANDPLVVQRFIIEARAGSEIRHPNVVRVLASGWLDAMEDSGGMPWLAMELLTGKTLAEALRI